MHSPVDPVTIERAGSCLLRAGLPSLPQSEQADLRLFGLDSLMMVLAVGELEREFEVSIGSRLFRAEAFATLASLASWILEIQRPAGHHAQSSGGR